MWTFVALAHAATLAELPPEALAALTDADRALLTPALLEQATGGACVGVQVKRYVGGGTEASVWTRDLDAQSRPRTQSQWTSANNSAPFGSKRSWSWSGKPSRSTLHLRGEDGVHRVLTDSRDADGRLLWRTEDHDRTRTTDRWDRDANGDATGWRQLTVAPNGDRSALAGSVAIDLTFAPEGEMQVATAFRMPVCPTEPIWDVQDLQDLMEVLAPTPPVCEGGRAQWLARDPSGLQVQRSLREANRVVQQEFFRWDDVGRPLSLTTFTPKGGKVLSTWIRDSAGATVAIVEEAEAARTVTAFQPACGPDPFDAVALRRAQDAVPGLVDHDILHLGW